MIRGSIVFALVLIVLTYIVFASHIPFSSQIRSFSRAIRSFQILLPHISQAHQSTSEDRNNDINQLIENDQEKWLDAETSDCAHPIYCRGEIIAAVQASKIFNDSKTFVDMPLRHNVSTVLDNFKNRVSLEQFLADNFYAAGSDVIPFTPSDFKDYPSFLHTIQDEKLRSFAHGIHRIWKDLVRIHRPIGVESTFIEVPYPFVVPGGRFREFYYWDSYWILEGLLVSGMADTARNILYNLLHIVKTIGFVPNGARRYFLNRSQPPLLTQMVVRYFDQTDDIEFLRYALPILDKEYDFWLKERSVSLKHPVTGNTHTLSVHRVKSKYPRPESWIEDVELVQGEPEAKKQEIFAEVAAACESGWDFSSRWFRDATTMKTIATSKIVPVDLNTFMYKNEADLYQLHSLIGNKESAQFYERQKELRKQAIDAFLYDQQDGIWYDYNIETNKPNRRYNAASYIPLWAKLHEGKDVKKIFNMMEKHRLFSFIGGIPTTDRALPQQWDYHNAWPPLQWLIVKGLQNIRIPSRTNSRRRRNFVNQFRDHQVERDASPNSNIYSVNQNATESNVNDTINTASVDAHATRNAAQSTYIPTTIQDSITANIKAHEIVEKWVVSNYCGWLLKDAMFEKYNASKIGVPGGGGEYSVQEGFGWTNGVILSFLSEYNTIQVDSSICYAQSKQSNSLGILILLAVLSLVAVSLIVASNRLYDQLYDYSLRSKAVSVE